MKKKKCNYGGTITPKRAIDMLPNRLPLVNIKPVQLNKSLGGDLLQTGVSFIPGLGQILSPLVGLVDSQITEEPVKAPEPLKLNMNPFGKLKNGVPFYAYQYKPEYRDTWGHGPQIGVMAHEVEHIPGAVSIHADGYKLVDYSKVMNHGI